ncbi:DUF2069 domain-containing protein [Salinicola avicenniae]|uniref:DUF2069 domain-containing protein n=1 Tax=Salinicola avicenniae TaxID=2916836 RepID=UPI002072E3F3|nr:MULTISPECIES: DUF2069 domain-containing protein [unclassified Salinicola]
MSHSHATADTLRRTRRAVWIAYLALLGLLVASGIFHYLQQHAQAAALLVRILPLALFLPTLLLQRRRGHIWLTALGVLYLVQGGMIFSEGGGSVLAGAEIIAAAALAVSAFRYARAKGPQEKRPS